jgi:hypothetical protein
MVTAHLIQSFRDKLAVTIIAELSELSLKFKEMRRLYSYLHFACNCYTVGCDAGEHGVPAVK